MQGQFIQVTKELTFSQNMIKVLQFYQSKHIVSYYANKGTSVFPACLDASLPFDRTNQNTLFIKLLKRSGLMCIVRLLELVSDPDP